MTTPTTPEPTLSDLARQVESLIRLVQSAADRRAADALEGPASSGPPAAAAAPDAIDIELARPPRTTATSTLHDHPAVVAFRQAADRDAVTMGTLGEALAVIERVLPALLARL